MQKQLEKIEKELSQRLYKLFLAKFDGNQSAFARASNCSETTVRRIFQNKQGITLNLLMRFSYALDVSVVELLAGFQLKADK